MMVMPYFDDVAGTFREDSQVMVVFLPTGHPGGTTVINITMFAEYLWRHIREHHNIFTNHLTHL